MPDPKKKKAPVKNTTKEIKPPLKYMPMPEKGMAAESTGYVRPQTTGRGSKLEPSIPERIGKYLDKNQEALEKLNSKSKSNFTVGPNMIAQINNNRKNAIKKEDQEAAVVNEKFVKDVANSDVAKYAGEKIDQAKSTYKQDVRPIMKKALGKEGAENVENFARKYGTTAAAIIGTLAEARLRMKPGTTNKLSRLAGMADDIPVVSNSIFSFGKKSPVQPSKFKRVALDIDNPINDQYIKTAKAKATKARNQNPNAYPEEELEVDEDELFKTKYSEAIDQQSKTKVKNPKEKSKPIVEKSEGYKGINPLKPWQIASPSRHAYYDKSTLMGKAKYATVLGAATTTGLLGIATGQQVVKNAIGYSNSPSSDNRKEALKKVGKEYGDNNNANIDLGMDSTQLADLDEYEKSLSKKKVVK